MNITRGPMLETFAKLIDTEIEEVVEWVNQYVNHPELATNPEATEKDRFASIKAYIQRRIENSSNARIRRSIEQGRRMAA